MPSLAEKIGCILLVALGLIFAGYCVWKGLILAGDAWHWCCDPKHSW